MVKSLADGAVGSRSDQMAGTVYQNTALCKHESGRIGCDTCPVPEG